VNGSLWTLPMELLAYGGLYALLLLGAGGRFRWLALVALVALIAWDRRLEEIPGAESAGALLSVPVESLVAFLVAFAIGVVVNLYRVPLSPLAAATGLAVLAVMPNSITGSFWMTLSVSYAVVVAGHFWPARLTVPSVWVNGSYGVYVWGFPIQQLLAMAGIRNQWLMLVCAAPLAYAMGTLSWKFIEEPTMQLRHYIAPGGPKREQQPGEEPEPPEERAAAAPDGRRRPEAGAEEQPTRREEWRPPPRPAPDPRAAAPGVNGARPRPGRPVPPGRPRREVGPAVRPVGEDPVLPGRFPPGQAPKPQPPGQRGRHARPVPPPTPEEETTPLLRRPFVDGPGRG